MSMGVRMSESTPQGRKELQRQVDRFSLRPWRTLRLGLKRFPSPARTKNTK
jgi:hypothetical protein